MGDRLRWGILSTARIAGTVFVPGVRASAETEVLAVGSRSLDAARSSYTFSENAESNDENALRIQSRTVVEAYSSYFDRLFTTYSLTRPALPVERARDGGSAQTAERVVQSPGQHRGQALQRHARGRTMS